MLIICKAIKLDMTPGILRQGLRRYLWWILNALLKICDILCGDRHCCLQGLKCPLNTSLSIPGDGSGKL